jgi:hypothetical protein
MSEWGNHNKPPESSKAGDTLNVKEKNNPATARVFTMSFKGMLLNAVLDAAKAKHLKPSQWIKETLENALIREGHLPSWWHSRQFKD